MNNLQRKIAFILYSDPMIYPPTMNAANIFAEHGWEVDVFCIRHPTDEYIEYASAVNVTYFDRHRRGFSLRIQYVLFSLWCGMMARKRRYKWIFSYDTMAVGPGKFAARASSAKWCYHNHDMWEASSVKGWYAWLKRLELRSARVADIVVFPQADRARIFAREAKLKKDPLVVHNGPRKKWAVQVLNPHPEILVLKQRCQKVALYQGGLSSDFELDKLIEALPLCKADVGICMVGKEIEPGIRERYLGQAQKLGEEKRILILPAMPYDKLPSVTGFCDVGIAKFTEDESTSVNDFYLAGASNKLAEYMAFGLPILAPDTPINRRFILQDGHGLVCRVSDPASVAENLDRLLLDNQCYGAIRQNNLRAFEERYNYDTQFNKVLEVLEGTESQNPE